MGEKGNREFPQKRHDNATKGAEGTKPLKAGLEFLILVFFSLNIHANPFAASQLRLHDPAPE